MEKVTSRSSVGTGEVLGRRTAGEHEVHLHCRVCMSHSWLHNNHPKEREKKPFLRVMNQGELQQGSGRILDFVT